jgi:hypothetical protein
MMSKCGFVCVKYGVVTVLSEFAKGQVWGFN